MSSKNPIYVAINMSNATSSEPSREALGWRKFL
jgi:hypothetical protein